MRTSPPRWVAGVDGCRSGWVVVLGQQPGGLHVARVVADFAAVLALPEAPSVIAIDVPIGLLAVSVAGGRACDVRARRQLGRRASSVFSAPTRSALAAFRAGKGYRAVSRANRGGVADAPGISKQTFCILPKIDEVDRALSRDPEARGRVFEVHPELCFAAANGERPMPHTKQTRAGRLQRTRLLRRLGFEAPLQLLGSRVPAGVNADDLLDACIACYTADRIATTSAIAVPPAPPIDACGLRMELWR